MSEETMVTTNDNPFDPFTQWNEWFEFDTAHGYNTCGLLGLYSINSDSLDDDDLVFAQQAVVRDSLSGRHLLVTRKSVLQMIGRLLLNEQVE